MALPKTVTSQKSSVARKILVPQLKIEPRSKQFGDSLDTTLAMDSFMSRKQ